MDEQLQAREQPLPASAETAPDELERYLAERFDLGSLPAEVRLPLPDEPFVSCWQEWAEEAERQGDLFGVLGAALPQLAFPIREGISETPDYRAATRRGVDPGELGAATGLALVDPEALELEIYPSPAGRIPILFSPVREDFETLVRALAKRNEPVPIPEPQGAAMVAGFNNWHRIAALRRRWEGLDPGDRATESWPEELARIAKRPELYQDRFILLWGGAYSGVAAEDLGLEAHRWRRLSRIIRRDHECAHYLTVRLFGRMRSHASEELLADYAGLVAAIGRFRADWFLRFMGIDGPGRVSPEGRLTIYRGDPPLSDGALCTLAEVLRSAASALERFDATWLGEDRSLGARARVLAALATLRLDELASPDAEDRVRESLGRVSIG